MTFLESNLQFNFDASNWKVLKYDAHKFYKTFSGAGLKGVDFVGIYQGEKLIFFEIKNFRIHPTKPDATFIVFEDTDLFVEQLKGKMEDTLTAIKVIVKYLQRKFWYRTFLKLEGFLPKSLVKNQDWYFWHQINTLRNSNSSQIFVLWLEIDSNYKTKTNATFFDELQEKLSEAFKHLAIKPKISNLKKPVFRKTLDAKKGT